MENVSAKLCGTHGYSDVKDEYETFLNLISNVKNINRTKRALVGQKLMFYQRFSLSLIVNSSS